MHKIQRHEYVGQPGELVQVATLPHNGGQVRVTVDGQDLGNVRTFSLPSTPGLDRHLHIVLAGPLGASCGIGVSSVDGGTDGDFLLCQPLNPLPFSDYTFKVATTASVTAFGELKGVAPAAAKASAAATVAKPRKRAKAKKAGKSR